jgi:lysophospholipase L1-like esterase
MSYQITQLNAKGYNISISEPIPLISDLNTLHRGITASNFDEEINTPALSGTFSHAVADLNGSSDYLTIPEITITNGDYIDIDIISDDFSTLNTFVFDSNDSFIRDNGSNAIGFAMLKSTGLTLDFKNVTHNYGLETGVKYTIRLGLEDNKAYTMLNGTDKQYSTACTETPFIKISRLFARASADFFNGRAWDLKIYQSNVLTRYYVDIISGVDVSGNGQHSTAISVSGTDYNSDQLYLLNYGYQLFNTASDGSGTYLEVPYLNTSVKIFDIAIGSTQSIAGTTYYLIREQPNSIGNHNMADFRLNFYPVDMVNMSGDTALISSGTAIQNAVNSWRTYMTWDRRQRIRQTGKLRYIKLYTAAVTSTNVASIFCQIWRKAYPAGTYTKVHDIDISSSIIDEAAGIKTIPFTNYLAVQEGDFYAFAINSPDAGLEDIFVCNPLSSKSDSLKHTDTNPATGYEWESTPTDQQLRLYVEGYITAPQMVGIGDSIMSGYPVHYSFWDNFNAGDDDTDIDHQILNKLQQLDSNVIYQNSGVNSDTTSGVISRMQIEIIDLAPRMGLVLVGTNDVNTGVANSTIINNSTTIIDNLIAADIIPIFVQILPRTGMSNVKMQNRDIVKAGIVSANSSKGCLIVDLDTVVGLFRSGGDAGNYWDIQPTYDHDGTHYTDAGNAAIAQGIYNAITASEYTIEDVLKPELDTFDKSNDTIHVATSGMDYFDKDKPYEWGRDEITLYSKYNGYFVTAYQDRVFAQILKSGSNITRYAEQLNYDTKKTSAYLTSVKSYCNI